MLLPDNTSQALVGAPGATLPRSQLESTTAVDLAVASGAALSRNEARTLLKGGGLYINNKRYRKHFLPWRTSFRYPRFAVSSVHTFCTFSLTRPGQVLTCVLRRWAVA